MKSRVWGRGQNKVDSKGPLFGIERRRVGFSKDEKIGEGDKKSGLLCRPLYSANIKN
jgi:hypothetical protein